MQPPNMTAYIQTGPSLTAQDELLFFDRAKKALENRDTYEDFLKLLNLYSRDVIDTKTLVGKVEEVFMGDGDLLAQFRELIDWDDQDAGIGIEWGPPGSVRTGPPEALSAMPVDDGLGPSYRRCPDSVSQNLSLILINLNTVAAGIAASLFW
jgi:paired amphipathic helix protein Sin3a